MAVLPRAFYGRQAPEVARDLLGKVLEKRTPDGVRRARIVETEAYGGSEDLASHARFGPTPRNAAMFGPPGRAYVYFVYGVHHCLNVVTGKDGQGQAVLIRAAEPLDGWDADLRGPGRLARAFAITREHDRLDLVRGDLRIVDGPGSEDIVATTRVGVDFAGSWADEPLRFLDAGSKAVSRRPAPAGRGRLSTVAKELPARNRRASARAGATPFQSPPRSRRRG